MNVNKKKNYERTSKKHSEEDARWQRCWASFEAKIPPTADLLDMPCFVSYVMISLLQPA